MATVTYVGVGSAVDPDRANTSMLFRGSINVLLDCGYGVPHAFWRLANVPGAPDPSFLDPNFLDAVWLSHGHADHCFGLPALLLWMRLEGRKRPLSVICGERNLGWIRKLLDIGYPQAFLPEKCYPLDWRTIPDGGATDVLGVRFEAAMTDHGVANFAVALHDGAASFAYSGDGKPTAGSERLFAGCDLVAHECFTASDAGIGGHADAASLVAMGERLGLRRLALIHHDPLDHDAIVAFAAHHDGSCLVTTPSGGETVVV